MADRIEVPERARNLCDLDNYDYADAFAADVVVTPSPRHWIERSVAEKPWLWKAVPMIHRRILRFHPDGPEETFGWRVEHESDSEAVLAAEGRLLTARVVAYSTPDQAVFATFVRYGHPNARAVWAAVAIAHRIVARHLVSQAVWPAPSAPSQT